MNTSSIQTISNNIQNVIPTGPKLPLETERLIVRDFIREDISDVIKIVSHPKFSGYLRFSPDNISHDVTSYVEEAIDMQKPKGPREVFRLAICLKKNPSSVIGCCVLHGWNKSPQDRDQLGYFIHPDYQGHGYATEAVDCLLTTYFAQCPNKSVEAIIHPNNEASRKVMLRLGFSKSGETTIDMHGTLEPRFIFSIRGTFFRALKNRVKID